MSYSYSYMRSVALVTLITLGTQIVAPIFQNTYAAPGTTYYVDATSGSDANDGLSSATGAWQTIARVNTGGFLPGDQILFKCGESWNESLVIQDSGNSGSTITFGQYGSCSGSNDPAISYTGGSQVTDSGSVFYVTIDGMSFSGSSSSPLLSFNGNGSGITITNSNFTNLNSPECIALSNIHDISVTNNTFSNCIGGVDLGDGGATVANNTFSDILGTAISMNRASPEVRTISDNNFSNLSANAISFGQNTNILHNIITDVCTAYTGCSAIGSIPGAIIDYNANITENFITNVGSGVLLNGLVIRDAQNVTIDGNTISNAGDAIYVFDSNNTTISNNTLYNPRESAIQIEEWTMDTTYNNVINNNTILTYNPDYSMVRIQDLVDNSGTLANFSGNKFLNVYKPKLPIIEILSKGGDSKSLDKDNLTVVDPTASNFTYFGYKTYTSTGSYSGGNLITNGAFGANITGWWTDVLALSHDNTGNTLHAVQGIDVSGKVSSNTFSVVSGGAYEISGSIKNITNSEGHDVKVRLQNSGGILYTDREIDVIATASGTTFKFYVRATTTAADAALDFILTNPNSEAEFDNISVREVSGLTSNPRDWAPDRHETILLTNTGSSPINVTCSSAGATSYCPKVAFPSQYVDETNTNISWPLSINPYSSSIVFWKSSTYGLYNPSGSLVPSNGSPANGSTVTFTWTASGSQSSIFAGNSTASGAFSYPVIGTGGTIDIVPPPSTLTTFSLTLSNDIGSVIYTSDVTSQNTSPVLTGITLTGSEGMISITGILTAIDPNPGDTIITYGVGLNNKITHTYTGPSTNGGSITIDSDGGDFTYTPPNSDFCGIDTFQYMAQDNHNAWNDETQYPYDGAVSIILTCVNDAPVTVDDSFTATGGVLQTLDVIANDTDVDSPYEPQTFTLSGFTQPANGTVAINGTQFDYTANPAFYGTDSFTYTIEDQSGALSNTATVTITVAPGSNFPPEVSGDSYALFEDTPLSNTLSGSDLNNDVLTFSASVLPTNGVLNITGSGFTYTPNANYYGSDSFTFFADDGTATSSGAVINLTISPVADAPVVSNDTINVEMNTLTTIDVLVNDADADNLSPTPANQGLTITGYTLPANGTLNLVGNEFQYTGSSGYLGPDTFDYIVEDSQGNISNTGTVNITVSTTNQPPVADSGSYVTTEDTLLVSTLSGSDPDATPVTFVLDTNVSNGALVLSSTGEFTYTPDANYNGSDSFTFHVSDGVLSSGTQTITIDVTPVNDAPTANNDTETGSEDTPSLLTPLANDADVDIGDTLSLVSILSAPSFGVATLSGTTFIDYTPTADYCGPDSLTYQIQDQSGALSNTGTITINVTCVNDGPTIADTSYTVTGNIPTNSGNVLVGTLTGMDIDGPGLIYILGTGASNGALIVNTTGGSFSYTPNLGFSGSDSFTYTINDGSLTSSSATVTITVNPNNLNLPPVANSGSVSTDEDTVLSGNATGSDPESAPLTFVLDSTTSNGVLSLSNTGGYLYTPNANYNGSDSFSFHVNDGVNNSSGATVTIIVNAVNDAPIANNDTASGTEDANINISPLSNDTDVDAGAILSLSGYTNGTNGTVTLSGTSMLIYTPNANYCGSDSVSYSAEDEVGTLSNTGTITMNVLCVNDVPVASNDLTATGTEDTQLTIAALSNDTDVEDGAPTNITNLTQPSTGGTVSIVGSNIVFTPTTNYCSASPITFTYQARDSASSLSNVATVTIPEVTCVNDAPVAQNASYTMTGNMIVGSGATNNMLIGTLSASDIEGNSLSFTLATLPSSGTASVSSTGTFSYFPSNGFVGSMTFAVKANDGLIDSNNATITICVISPNSSIARPACAPALPVAPAQTITGGGGGGGGGSTSSFSYGSAVSNGTSPELTSQLYLAQQDISSGSVLNSVVNSVLVPYSNLINIINNIVELTNNDTSTQDGAPTIRKKGKSIIQMISSSDTDADEKLSSIDNAASDLEKIKSKTTNKRERNAIAYLLRIFNQKKSALLIEIEILKNFIMQ